ncbi:two-component system sensor histidine kinase NtrB [Parvularcula lutaonensis]|uniref:histidine kinase n=1 Tax=Parvularcula lutaonensis TaxID=491923 RepID=A0ABV7M8V2_9PROT|nr:PAS domain-containing sensor histidine kinase [Parvularcula lutaonensis]GGY45487.1 hypothetical protein GCM10007148_13100 [Parvularcula lutaonensis]
MFEQQQLRALIDTAVDGILSISADGRVRLYNRASERIFGYSAEEVLGQDVAMLMPEHHARNHGQYIENYLSTGEARIIGIGRQVQGVKKDGSVFPLHLSVGEFREAGERYFVGIIHDLSEQMAERERTRALQEQIELIGRHSAVSEMGAALAHELNQPLTAVDLFLVAAERKLENDPDGARRIFARVREEAERAGNIVRRIRQMVERSDGEHSLFDLGQVIDSAVELCRTVSQRPDTIRIETTGPAMLFGDSTQIRMILVNLIKNALDAVGDQPRGQVVVRVRSGDPLRIEVLDNGPGVGPEFEDKLFQPFASTKTKGLGIGLSICRTIAEAHGGRLLYKAPDGYRDGLGGASFILELPQPDERNL